MHEIGITKAHTVTYFLLLKNKKRLTSLLSVLKLIATKVLSSKLFIK